MFTFSLVVLCGWRFSKRSFTAIEAIAEASRGLVLPAWSSSVRRWLHEVLVQWLWVMRAGSERAALIGFINPLGVSADGAMRVHNPGSEWPEAMWLGLGA